MPEWSGGYIPFARDMVKSCLTRHCCCCLESKGGAYAMMATA